MLAESASLPLGELEMVVLDLRFLLEELSPEEPPREDWVLESPWAPMAKAPLPGGFRLEDLTLSLPHWAAAMLSSPPPRGQRKVALCTNVVHTVATLYLLWL